MDTYYEIAKAGEGQYREKMSRFLAFAMPVYSAEEAKAKVKDIQNKYCDARHVCWAYMLGAAMSEYQLNDNGEPSGTAGKPILGQIRSKGVTNVLVAVVRYFGGIKLGTSGLIVAYKEAAALALEDAGKVEMHAKITIKVEVPYASADKVMRIVKEDSDIMLLESEFNNLCSMTISVREDKGDALIGRLASIEGIWIEKAGDD